LEGYIVIERFHGSTQEGQLSYMTPVIKEREEQGGSARKL